MKIRPMFILACAYVIYHICNGNRSLFVYLDKKQIVQNKTKHLELLKEQSAKLENKINRLQDTGVDTDLLEEEAIKVLGQSEPDNVVIVKPAQDFSNQLVDKIQDHVSSKN